MVRLVWRNEFPRFSRVVSEQIFVIADSTAVIPASARVVICSYDLAVKLKRQLIAWRPDVVVCDEAHMLKEPGSKRTGAVFGSWASGAGGLACNARYAWMLSGTPAPNNPGELYAPLKFFGAWRASWTEFLDRYTRYDRDQFGGVRVKGIRNAAELRSLLKPWILRRRKAEVLPHLPPLTISELPVDAKELDPAHPVAAKLRELEPQYAAALADAVACGDFALPEAEWLATLRRLVGLLKVRSVAEIVSYELDHGRSNVVLFALHRDVIEGLAHLLDRFGVGVIHGATPDREKEDALQLFDAGIFRVLILQIKTAGVGLTITASDNCILAEASWCPADNDQAIARLHRQGQKLPVTARFASLAGSIDEKVSAALARKSACLSELEM